jgi:hypothetical protein
MMEDDPEPSHPSEEEAVDLPPAMTTTSTDADDLGTTAAAASSAAVAAAGQNNKAASTKDLLRVSQLYGSGVAAAQALTMAGKPLRLGSHPLVNTGPVDTNFPYTDADLASARRKVFENRELHAGAGVRALELAITSASISFHELQRALVMCLKLQVTAAELAALLALFRCVDTFKRKGRVLSRVVVKPFLTGLMRLAETLRDAFRQKVRQEHEEAMVRQQEAQRFLDDHYTIDKPALRVPAALARSLSTVLATGAGATSITSPDGAPTAASAAPAAPVQLALLLSRRGLDAAATASSAWAPHGQHNYRAPLAPVAGLDGLDKLRDAAQRTWARYQLIATRLPPSLRSLIRVCFGWWAGTRARLRVSCGRATPWAALWTCPDCASSASGNWARN